MLLDFVDTSGIESVGLYLTRQGVLVRWPLEGYLRDLHGQPVDLGKARSVFEDLLVRVQPS